MTSGATDCGTTPLAYRRPGGTNGKPDPGKHLMPHMRLNIQSSVVVKRIPQLEKDICNCTGRQEYKHRGNTHRTYRNTIEEFSLMPDPGERPNDQSEA